MRSQFWRFLPSGANVQIVLYCKNRNKIWIQFIGKKFIFADEIINRMLPEHPESRVIKESDPLSESGSPEWKRDNDNY